MEKLKDGKIKKFVMKRENSHASLIELIMDAFKKIAV